MKMFVKGISTEDFSKNCLGWTSNRSLSDEDHDCFIELSSNLPQRVVQYFYRNSVASFQEQKTFVVKTVFLLAYWLRHV